MQIREFFFRRFFGTLGWRFPVRFFFFSSSSFFFPLSALGVGLGCSSFLLSVLLPGRPSSSKAGHAQHMPCLFSLFFSLCPAGPPLPCPFFSFRSFFLSFFLSFSLSFSCMHSDTKFTHGIRSESCSENCGGCIAPVVGCHFANGFSYSEDVRDACRSGYGILRELLRELRWSFCSSRGVPSRDWNFDLSAFDAGVLAYCGIIGWRRLRKAAGEHDTQSWLGEAVTSNDRFFWGIWLWSRGFFCLFFASFCRRLLSPLFFRVPLFLALFAARLSDRSSFFLDRGVGRSYFGKRGWPFFLFFRSFCLRGGFFRVAWLGYGFFCSNQLPTLGDWPTVALLWRSLRVRFRWGSLTHGYHVSGRQQVRVRFRRGSRHIAPKFQEGSRPAKYPILTRESSD